MSRKAIHWTLVALAVAAAMLPLVVRSDALRADATNALLLLVAAIGLNLAAGYAGQPSLGQGGFVGLGAYGTAILRAHAGLGPVLAATIAVLIAVLAGVIVARGVARLRPAFVALATWLVAWTVALAIGAFPGLTGGSSGLVLGPARLESGVLGVGFTLGTIAWFEISLFVLVVVWLTSTSWLGRFGPALATLRSDAGAASAAGVPVARLRARALVLSAGAAGLAGALLVQATGVADPTTYDALLSLELFLIVVLGGPATLAGPAAGLIAMLAVARFGEVLAGFSDADSARLESLSAGVLVLVVLVVARAGIVPPIERALRRRREPRAIASSSPRGPATVPGARIELRDASVVFDGIRALDGVTLDVQPAACHALIGPNGSGKTTCLRVLSGALRLHGAPVVLDGRALGDDGPEGRVAAGIARTFQRLAVAQDLTALEHIVSGMEPRRTIGTVRAALATPEARAEHRDVEARAHEILASVGLEERADDVASELNVGEQRMLQVARALAASPSVLLLDEPSAGMDVRDEVRLLVLIARLRDTGMTIVLVEHNLSLVRAVADRVTVLDAGRVIAEGTPDEVARDEAVRAAYLGLG